MTMLKPMNKVGLLCNKTQNVGLQTNMINI